MKSKTISFILLATLAMACNPCYYQICSLKSDSPSFNEEKMVYEDNNCIISYNFWCESGNPGFVITNKTKQTLYVDLSASFFIKNGLAYDYYLDRRYMSSHTNAYFSYNQQAYMQGGQIRPSAYPSDNMFLNNIIGIYGAKSSVGKSVAGTNGIEYGEKPVIAIPAGTSKCVSEYCIEKDLFISCDDQSDGQSKGEDIYTVRHNSNANEKSVKEGIKSYSEDNTPLTFSNIISYRIGENKELTQIKNSFYVNETNNIFSKKEYTASYYKDCLGKKRKGHFMKDKKMNRFYNIYYTSDFK